MTLNSNRDKNKKLPIIIGAVVVVIILVLLLIPKNKNDYKNIRVYKGENEIELTKDNISIIKDYLKNEKFEKSNNNCSLSNIYAIEADNVELVFDNDDCGVYFENKKTHENHYTEISEGLKDYIINIAN